MSDTANLSKTLEPSTRAARLWTLSGFRDDCWQHLEDAAPWPGRGSVIVSINRWRTERDERIRSDGLKVGAALAAGDDVDPARDALHRLRLVVLPFPKFTDGRAYSTARRMREQWGYRGELRASGDVLFDQLPLMLRCGFDSFEITDAATLSVLQRAGLPMPDRMYQPPHCVSPPATAASSDQRVNALAAAE